MVGSEQVVILQKVQHLLRTPVAALRPNPRPLTSQLRLGPSLQTRTALQPNHHQHQHHQHQHQQQHQQHRQQRQHHQQHHQQHRVINASHTLEHLQTHSRRTPQALLLPMNHSCRHATSTTLHLQRLPPCKSTAAESRASHRLSLLLSSPGCHRIGSPHRPLLSSPGCRQWGSHAGSRAEAVAGALDDVAGKADDVAGQADDVAGKADDVAGKADDVAGKADDVAEDAKLVEVKVPCRGDQADTLVDCLLSVGAVSCSIEDANKGTEGEEEIFGDGSLSASVSPSPALWDPQAERRLWVESTVTAMFPSSHADVGLSLRLALHAALLENTDEIIAEAMRGIVDVASDDWIQSVKDLFTPVEVSDDFWVVPPWCTLPPTAPPDSFTLKLEPGLAFGTGEHQTTRLCLRWLRTSVASVHQPPVMEAAIHPGPSVLDFGCGSGILSIAALKLGARVALGVDIDAQALSSSRHNAELNGIQPSSFKLLLATEDCPNPLRPNPLYPNPNPVSSLSAGAVSETNDEREEEFDIVVANILLNPLLRLSGDLCQLTRPGGRVGLSGVLVSQVEAVLDAYKEWAEDVSVFEDDGWALVSFRRKI